VDCAGQVPVVLLIYQQHQQLQQCGVNYWRWRLDDCVEASVPPADGPTDQSAIGRESRSRCLDDATPALPGDVIICLLLLLQVRSRA